MKWTLLVPGALLPAALAPEISRALHAPRLAQRLRQARAQPVQRAAEGNVGAAHWSWLAQAFGLGADPAVTAPYAWRALGTCGSSGAEPEQAAEPLWIAHCDPVHMAIARDHLTVTDLGEEPLDPEETAALLNLANEAAGDLRSAPLAQSASNSGERLDLHFVIRGGHWFVVSPAPLALQTFALDSVLGRSVQEHMPSGAHARAWRILSNEIQMLWHSSAVNDAREQRGARTANALWLHGGGAWAALGPRGVGTLRVDVAPNMGLSAGLNAGPDAGLATASPGPQLIGTAPSSRDAAVLHGWQLAGAGRPEAGAVSPGRTLSVHRELFAPFAHQAWDAWLARVPAWEERLEQELTLAQRQGARHFELVLCGGQESRSYAIALRNPGSPLDAVTGWVRRLPLVGGGALRTSGAGDWARLAESAESDPSTPSGASGGFAPTAQTVHRSGMAR